MRGVPFSSVATSTAHAVSPASRVLRTILFTVVAVAGAVPSAVALLGLSAELAAKVTGIAGALVILVTAAWNALEGADKVPTLLARK